MRACLYVRVYVCACVRVCARARVLYNRRIESPSLLPISASLHQSTQNEQANESLSLSYKS